MKKTITSLSLLFICILANAQYTTIASDGTGDGVDKNLLDGTKLEYYHNTTTDSLWFRITCAGINTTQAMNLGFNIMVNIPGGGNAFTFWGNDNKNAFHKLVTGWVTGTPPSNYTGDIGITDSTGVDASNWTRLVVGGINISVDTNANTITVGMKRRDLVSDNDLGKAIVTAAAVGSSSNWNDDIYISSGTMTLSSPVSIENVLEKVDVQVFPNPSENHITVNANALISSVDLYSISGKLLRTFTQDFTKLDLSENASGMYLIKTHTAQGEFSTKVALK